MTRESILLAIGIALWMGAFAFTVWGGRRGRHDDTDQIG